MNKSVFDMAHVKSVTAWALLFNGQEAGKIVANWSDNPNGSVCTVRVCPYIGPLAECNAMQAKASGCGYCKLSAAIYQAIYKTLKLNPVKNQELLASMASKPFDSAGESATIAWFESIGYKVIRII